MEVPRSASLSRRRLTTSSWYGRRVVVVLVAVTAGEVATPHWNQMGQNRMTGGDQGAADEAKLTKLLTLQTYFFASAEDFRTAKVDIQADDLEREG